MIFVRLILQENARCEQEYYYIFSKDEAFCGAFSAVQILWSRVRDLIHLKHTHAHAYVKAKETLLNVLFLFNLRFVQFYHGVRAVRPAVYAVLFLEHRSVFYLGGGDPRREDISIISVKENQREEEEGKRGGASPRSFATRTREHLFFNVRFIALRVSCFSWF